jgi:NTE family protein
VLRQLQHVTLRFDSDTGQVGSCDPNTNSHCEERSLLDQVDVISSVSGGSFTAAYYVLNRDKIFEHTGRFHESFLYAPIERDLLGRAVYQPWNWRNLGSRPEIAARLYSDRIFDQATFADIHQRPYLILNATDASTGNRFEFTQEQFDMLCADLSPFPIARAVAASSAFPGLLNSMTIDSHNASPNGTSPCGYTGPGSGGPFDWAQRVLSFNSRLDLRYADALAIKAYRDPSREYLHLLDGGLSDNIGLPPVLRSLGSLDRPTTSRGVQGGWSLLQMMDSGETDTVLVIAVNAKTDHANDWDTRASGPGTLGVIGLSSGVPMSNYSSETLELLRQTAIASRLNEKNRPKLYGVDISFDSLSDAAERQFFAELGTSLELRPFEVDCLIDRGQQLVRDATISTTQSNVAFADFVKNELHGTIQIPSADSSTNTAPASCTADAAKRLLGVRDHFIDIGVDATSVSPKDRAFARSRSPGVAFRLVRPTGWNVTIGLGPSSLSATETIGGQAVKAGDLGLFGLTGGLLRAFRAGRLEATLGASAGYALGSFSLSTDALDAFGRNGNFGVTAKASNTWLAQPRAGVWFDLNDWLALTASTSYTFAHSRVVISSDHALIDQRIDASAFRFSFGVGFKVF